MEINPYAPPQAEILATPAVTDAEKVRREHLNTEATLKSVGVLYYLGAFLLIVFASISIAAPPSDGLPLALQLVFLALGLIQGITAYGLRRLRAWVQIPTTIVSLIGLLGFPIGTLINAYILYQVWSKKGRFVVTPEYHQIIAATPHVKRKTSVVVWVLLIVLIVILVISLLAAFFS